jgi:imidazolonepropionase-like amidohydrolase
MRYRSLLAIAMVLAATAVAAQVQPPPAPWRGAGPVPCVGPEGGIYKCPAAARVIVVRAGRLFESQTGQMLRGQIVILSGDRIAAVGPEAEVEIPVGARVIDLSQATVLPGLVDAHTHMFNNRQRGQTAEAAMLIAVQNAQADLRAGFTTARDMSSHGNGYADVELRDAINQGRIEGPRLQVSTRGIGWAAAPANPSNPDNPLERQLVRNVEEARAAVREQIAGGADWIKLYPTGSYTFDASGVAHYELT